MKPLNTATELILKQLTWDYYIPAVDLYQCLAGTLEKAGFYTRQSLSLKAFTNLAYSDLIRLFDISEINGLLTPEFIQKMRNPNHRLKYEILRRILHQEALPASKWDNRTNPFPEYPILSNRWYGA